MACVFWNALLFLMNSAKVLMPVFVPKRVASWWSGAPLSIILPYSLCNWHSNTMCSQVCSPALHGQLVGCGFGSIHQSICVQFWLVLLSLVCISQVCRMCVSLLVRAVCSPIWCIILLNSNRRISKRGRHWPSFDTNALTLYKVNISVS